MPVFTVPQGIRKTKMGSLTRSAAGTQAITGVGFKPKVVFFNARATGGTYQIASMGFDNGIGARCLRFEGNSVDIGYAATRSIYLLRDGDNYIQAYITSMDADGFTLEWALVGTVSAYVLYLAMA